MYIWLYHTFYLRLWYSYSTVMMKILHMILRILLNENHTVTYFSYFNPVYSLLSITMTLEQLSHSQENIEISYIKHSPGLKDDVPNPEIRSYLVSIKLHWSLKWGNRVYLKNIYIYYIKDWWPNDTVHCHICVSRSGWINGAVIYMHWIRL